MAGEKVCDEEETGSSRWLAVPTGLHDPHHDLWCFAGSRHWVSAGHLLHDLFAAQGGVGVELVWVEHLPLEDSETPDVRGWGEDTFADALGSHPANGGRPSRVGHKQDALAGRDLSHETEISNFTKFIFIDQNVACCQILGK